MICAVSFDFRSGFSSSHGIYKQKYLVTNLLGTYIHTLLHIEYHGMVIWVQVSIELDGKLWLSSDSGC